MKYLNLAIKYIISYRLRSIAIVLSIILSISLIIGVGTLRETNNNTELQSMKYKYGPYQVTFNGIDKDQLNKIDSNSNIEHLGIHYLYKSTAKQEKQTIDIIGANEDYIYSSSSLKIGRIPQNKNEIVAEEWVLRLLGFDLEVNQEITLKVESDTNEYENETFKLVGIINDIPGNKIYGRRNLFTYYDSNNINEFFASIEFKNGVNINNEINNISEDTNIAKENIHTQSDMINLEDTKNKVNISDFQFITIISVVCGFVIYGIFNISIYSRIREYSILHAIGFNSYNILKLVLTELLCMYAISVPIGTISGISIAMIFNSISESIDTNIILHGELIELDIMIPIYLIIVSIIFIGIIIVGISLLVYKQIKMISIIEGIKNNIALSIPKNNKISVTYLRRIMKSYLALSIKNTFRSKKSLIMIVLSLSICGIFFIMSNYNLTILDERINYQNWQLHSNSDFQIDVYNEDKSKGIPSKYKLSIADLEGVENLETSKLIPSKMVLNGDEIINRKYFENINSVVEDMYLKSYLDRDENTNELLLKNSLRGYNDNALEKLNNYLISGNINIQKMKSEGLAILCIPQTNKDSFNALPDGNSVLDVSVGDIVTIKFRENKIIDDEYYTLDDHDEKYIYKEFEIGAIVSYNYMYDGFERSVPSANIILSENIFTEITGVNDYYSINVNMDNGYDDEKLEKEISKITSDGENIRPRNLIKERENTEALYYKSKIYNIGITVIIFIVVTINIINNINYTIVCRKNEFSVLRAIGLNEIDLKKMIILEGIFYCIISNISIVIFGVIIQMGLYDILNLSSIGLEFSINIDKYILIMTINLILVILITYINANKISNSNIIQNISKVE